jgi:AraC family transcriptional regulator
MPVAMPIRHFTLAGMWRADLLSRAPYRASFTPEKPAIGFAFDGQVGIHAFGCDRKTSFRARPNGLAFVPAGCDVYSESECGGEYLKITYEQPQSTIWSWARRFSDDIDPAVINAAHRVRQLLLAGTIDRLQCEHLVGILSERASQMICPIEPKPVAASYMTPHRLKLIEELIEARFMDGLTVHELAAAVDLSAGFFARAFKAAIGKAPHDHIIDRRISYARALLQKPRLDLSTIAHASGFSSHAHMTTAFRKRLGINPSELRSE